MQLSKETIKYLVNNELNELLNHCDLTDEQFSELRDLTDGLRNLFYGEPLEITLADE